MRLENETNRWIHRNRVLVCLVVCTFVFELGCVPRVENEVVIYAASDREYASPILDAFERSQPKLTVSRQFDVEATKTLGLVTRIQQESKNPRCDVFWNNEILHTIRLQRDGLLRPRKWNVPNTWPTGFRASDGTWVGFAARARILIINTEKLPNQSDRPKSVLELADSNWSGQCGVASPMFGTAATHFAVLSTHLPIPETKSWFVRVRENAVVLSGNKQVAQAVSSGQLSWGLTDTDDAIVEKENGLPVVLVFPDQLSDEMGTLFIPNCVAVLQGGPHPAAADLLADYLISEATESRLTLGNSAQFPVWPNPSQRSRAEPTIAPRWMQVDFEKAADAWPALAKTLIEIFRS